MSGWTAKRFWTETSVIAEAGGYAIALDGRRVRTPTKAALVVPARALAEAIAAEWQAQGEKVDPATMPLTRTANSALDKVAPQRAEVAAMLAAYGETDLLCYRAEGPDELVARQAAGWDRWLDWAADRFDARLAVTAGIVPVEQSPETLAALARQVDALDPWELAAFHDLVALTGSLILGLALAEGVLSAESAWTLSRLDEDWQAEQWGRDEEADDLAETRRRALHDAKRFWDALHSV